MRWEELDRQNIIPALAELFHSRVDAEGLLYKAGIVSSVFRPFDSSTPIVWWNHVLREIIAGRVTQTVENVLEAAADIYPGNPIFDSWRSPSSKPDQRERVGGNIEIVVPDSIDPKVLFEIIERATTSVGRVDSFKINMVRSGSSRIDIYYPPGTPPDEVQLYLDTVREMLLAHGIRATITRPGHTFRDYFMDPLYAEGPDGHHFALEGTLASTPVGEVSRAVISQYADDKWPTSQGQQRAVADLVSHKGGTSRLNPEDTLHDAGVRPGDTVRVSPERTAGGVDPRLREEAIARVRGQVLEYAAANPGFQVSANSAATPTEYLFAFRIPGFAPPSQPGERPRVIQRHEVLVELPPDFPVKAPIAWWQTEVFHPNIDPRTGLVCLGVLKDHYRSGLDFGELCAMLVDMAGYRNYVLSEGYNAEAMKWATSSPGQADIRAIGGMSIIQELLAGTFSNRNTIRRIRRVE